ncbi:MAG: hypothetical protein R6W78_12850 [Bacteroidales bacterium]
MKKYPCLKIILLSLTIAGLGLFISCGNTDSKSGRNDKKFSAKISFKDGNVQQYDNFHRLVVSHALYSEIRTDVPDVTYVKKYSLPVDIGPYETDVPFEIIRNITFEIKKDSTGYNEYIHAVVVLGDNSVIEGRTWALFKGNTSLGESSARIADDMQRDKLNLTRIVFDHEAGKSFEAKPFGKHTATLIQADGNAVKLLSAGFMKEKVNDNGCYLEDEYSENMDFKSESQGEYEIDWKKIASITQDDPEINLFNNFLDYRHQFKLKTRDGQEYKGSCQTWAVAVHNVRGITTINSNYNLQVTVPLYMAHYSKITFGD